MTEAGWNSIQLVIPDLKPVVVQSIKKILIKVNQLVNVIKLNNVIKHILFILIFSDLLVGSLIAQTREEFSSNVSKFISEENAYFHLPEILKSDKYDSVVVIHYKGSMLILGVYKDSLDIIQNFSVAKLNSPTSKKVILKKSFSAVIYSGKIDSSIFGNCPFRALFDFGNLRVLNNPRFKITSSTPNSNFDDFYFESYINENRIDHFKLLQDEMHRNSYLVCEWQIRRLILQIYLDGKTWYNVTNMIKRMGAGYYVMNNLLEFNSIYFFDKKQNKFIHENSKRDCGKYYPFYFVDSQVPHPEGAYSEVSEFPSDALIIDF